MGMVLPRLLWICVLTTPARHAELIRSLLPHCFDAGPCSAQTDTSRHPVAGSRLARLLDLFQRARELPVNARPASAGSAEQSNDEEHGLAARAAGDFWEVLVRKAVGEDEAASEGTATEPDELERKAVEDLM